MSKKPMDASMFGSESIFKILLKTAPPVMLALLIQALYNIVDSFFVGKFSEDGLTALSVIYPLQLIVIAFAVGTGVGVNTLMAKLYAKKSDAEAKDVAGTGIFISLILWVIFAALLAALMKPYVAIQTNREEAREFAYSYGMIVCVGSLGVFTESIFSKILQARGDMVLPTIAQIVGAVINIILDPIFIFNLNLGVAGAAYATVLGQFAAAIITGLKAFNKFPSFAIMKRAARSIFSLGLPSIIMQAFFTVYILVFNVILAKFCDEAVTVLGLYYKIQSFFFIPLTGLQTCIVPIISYNYAQAAYGRVRKTFGISSAIIAFFMAISALCFLLIPRQLLGIFSSSEKVFEIGEVAFRIIGLSFLPATMSFMSPVLFQAIGKSRPSIWLTLSRQAFCLIPIFYALSFVGLNYVWIAFPAAEIITGAIGTVLYVKEVKIFKSARQLDANNI